MASVNLGRVKGDKGVGFRYRGDWNATEEYVNSSNYIDTVTYNGNMWICVSTNKNVAPSESSQSQWSLGAKSVANVYFEQATTRENLESGEEVSTSFGKISKWFADLKAAAFSLVANNVTTTASGSVLDARQGKVINDRVDKIYTDKLVTLEEIDLVTEEGFFVDALATKELNSKLTSDTLLWEGSSFGPITVPFADDIYKYNYLIFANDTTVLYTVPIIKGLSKMQAGNNMLTNASTMTVNTCVLDVTVVSNTSINFRSVYLNHVFTGGHTDGSGITVTKIYGKM